MAGKPARLVEVSCPCCHEVLTVDPAAGAVVQHRKGAHSRTSGTDLSAAVQRAEKKSDLAEQLLGEAHARQKARRQNLDALFSSSLDRAKEDDEDDGETPRHPLGLD